MAADEREALIEALGAPDAGNYYGPAALAAVAMLIADRALIADLNAENERLHADLAALELDRQAESSRADAAERGRTDREERLQRVRVDRDQALRKAELAEQARPRRIG